METENNKKDLFLKILDKYLGGIKEYAGILTLLFTTGATIISSLLKLVYYVHSCGFVCYWSLPIEIIDIYSKNTSFNIAIYFILSLFVYVVNRCFYMLFHKFNKKRKFGLSIALIAYILLPVSSIFVALKLKNVAIVIVLIFVLLLILVFPAHIICVTENAFVNKTSTKKEKKKIETKNEEKIFTLKDQIWRFVAVVTITTALELGLVFVSGFVRAESTANFKVIEMNNNTCAIIYETNDAYYISPCEIENGRIINIDKNSKELIAKENITYTHYQYSE